MEAGGPPLHPATFAHDPLAGQIFSPLTGAGFRYTLLSCNRISLRGNDFVPPVALEFVPPQDRVDLVAFLSPGAFTDAQTSKKRSCLNLEAAPFTIGMPLTPIKSSRPPVTPLRPAGNRVPSILANRLMPRLMRTSLLCPSPWHTPSSALGQPMPNTKFTTTVFVVWFFSATPKFVIVV